MAVNKNFRLKKIADKISHAVTIAGKNGEIIYVNDYGSNITAGHTSFHTLISPDRYQEFHQLLESRKPQKEIFNLGSIVNTNKPVLYQIEFEPLEDKITMLHLFACELSERHPEVKSQPKSEMEQELEKYKTLVEDQVDLVIRWRPDFHLTFGNQSFLKFFGLDAADLSNFNLLDHLHPEDQEKVKLKIASLTPEEPIKYDERQVLTPDGKSHWQEWTDRGFFTGDGRLAELQSVGRDVSSLKQANYRIRESEARLNIALNAAEMGLWDWQIVQDQLTYSENLTPLFAGKLPGNIKEFLETIDPDDRNTVESAIDEVVKQPQNELRVEFRFLRYGKQRWFASRGSVYQTRKGKPVRMAGAILEITRQKLSDQALKDSEERYRSVVSAMKEGVLLYSEAGEIITCNRAAREILDLTINTENGRYNADKLWRSFHEDGTPFPPETHPAIVTLKTGIPQRDVIMGIRRKDNRMIWISVNSQPIFSGKDPTPSSVVVSFNDVTLQKEAQEALVEGEKRYRSLFESANDAILLIRNDRIIECNPKGLEYFGVQLKDVINLPHQEFFPHYQPDRSLSSKKFRQKVEQSATEEQQFFTWTYKRSDGSLFDAEISLTRYILNNEEVLLAIIRDYTERKKHETEIKKLALVAQNIDNAVVITDKKGIIEWVNDGFSRVTGYSFEEAVGKKPSQIVHGPETDQKVVKKIWKKLASGEHVRAELINYNKKKRKFWLELNIQPILDDNNRLQKYISIQRDITQRKKHENAINHQNSQLIKANQELDNFVYSVSHDLRAPITSALGLIEISRKTNNMAEIRNYLELQKNSLIKMDKFIQDILNYSRNTRMEIQKDEIDFSILIEETLAQYSFIKGAQEIEKSTEIEQECIFISDRRRLSVILSNLISNAIQFANPFRENPFIRINVQVKPDKANIKIHDNGIGIDKIHLNKIFDMFYRATNYQPGSGLGLYIVKESIEKMKGKIAVESELGHGTTFTLMIPSERS